MFDVGNRALVFGGAYGNLQATEAILKCARELGFSPDQIIFTGDSAAYCGQPSQTVQLIRDTGIHVIMGNCEESLAQDADDCGCGFDEGTECDLLSAEWYRFCKNALDAEAKEWMRRLPKSVLFKVGDSRLQCFHGTPAAINQFVFSSNIKNRDIDLQPDVNVDGYLVGHSGIPFLAEIGGKAWINSGAAGMPANDGTPRVWFSILESKNGELIVQTHPLEYDHKAAAEAMAEAGLENGYRDCLYSGIWPSHDVLPQFERLTTGKPLAPSTMIYRPNCAMITNPLIHQTELAVS
ncbi:MAG: metallophosphoesterase family protein [Rhizobiaceae bacterium]